MEEIKRDKTQRMGTFLKYIELTVLALFMLVSIAGAAPFAYIANSYSGTVSVIDTATNSITATVPVGVYPIGVSVSSDGTKAYVTNEGSYPSYDGTVSVIDTKTNTVTDTLNAGKQPIGVTVNPTGKKLYVTNGLDNIVSVIDTVTKTITPVSVGYQPLGVAIIPDGSKVYVTNSLSHSVSVIDTTTNNITATVPVGVYPFGIAVSLDGSKVYVVNHNGSPSVKSTISVIDTSTDTVTDTLNAGINPDEVAIAPDGSKVYVTNIDSNAVSVIDTATKTVTSVPVGQHPYGVAITPDGTKVYVTNNQGDSVSVIDTATNQVSTTVNVGHYPLTLGQFIGPTLSKETPTITWNNPDDITAGTALSGTQLNAVASVPGTFVYTPAAGTVLDVGTQTLHVDFTPTDTANYTNTTANVTINVLEKPVALVADFSASPTTGKAPLTVTFTDSSTGSPTSWSWNFGDKSISTEKNPVHQYIKAGKYTVSLTVKNELDSNTRKISNYVIVNK